MVALAGILAATEIASNVANVIQVGIMVNDNLTPALETYEGKIENLDQATDSWFNQFTRSIPTTMLDSLKVGVDYIRDGLWSAAQMQTAIIASSSDLATNLKVPIGDARKLIEDSQVAIANIAAALPGETAGYADIYRSISGTLSKEFKGDDFKTESENFTKRIGLLASIRGADMNNAGQASNRFLAGTMTFGEVITQDVFGRNPALYAALLEQLETMKVDPEDWKNIKQSIRTKVFSAALAKAAPDALIAEFEGTFQGTVETIKTQIFDPISGLFGILRKVDGKENRTTLDAANGILQAMKSVGDTLVTLAGGLGLNLDPLFHLITFFDEVTKVVNQLRATINSDDTIKAVESWLADIPTKLGDFIVSAIKYVSGLMERLLGAGLTGKSVGNVVGMVTNLFENLKDKVLDNIDVKQLAALYFQVSKEIADFQSQLWWASIKIIPVRIGNYFSEMWLGFVKGLEDIKVVFSRFIDLIGNIFKPLVEMLESLGSLGKPTAVMAGAGIDVGDGSIKNNPVVNGITGAASSVGGLFDKVFNKPATRILAPTNKSIREKQEKGAFAPVVNINASTTSSATDIASMVTESLNNAFNEYSNGLLA